MNAPEVPRGPGQPEGDQPGARRGAPGAAVRHDVFEAAEAADGDAGAGEAHARADHGEHGSQGTQVESSGAVE